MQVSATSNIRDDNITSYEAFQCGEECLFFLPHFFTKVFDWCSV